MRISALIPLVFAAGVSALPAHLSGSRSGVERRGVSPPAPRDEHAGIAAEHARARARRSGLAHGSDLRKVRRRKVAGQKRQCRPRSTSTQAPLPTGGDWTETWSRPHGSSSWDGGKGDYSRDGQSHSSHHESSSGSSNPWGNEVSSGDNDWSGSATTTTSKGEHNSESSTTTGKGDHSSEPSPTPSSSSDDWWNGDNGTSSASPSPKPSSKPDENNWGNHSSTSTSSSEGTKPSESPSSGGEVDNMLMPLGRGTAAWSTSPSTSNALSFEEALLPLQWGRLPEVGKAPDGSVCYQQTYPGGSYGKGFSFYFQGDKQGVSIEGAKEVTFSYSVFFKEGFEWTKGGKLPGLYGGTSLESAKSCSGGRQSSRDDCFSARLMWRANGAGEFYNYFPPSAKNDYCNLPPMSTCNKDYGDSIARGAFTWATGKWTTVAQRLKLNDTGQKNGEQELFVNGKSVINLKNVEIAVHPGTSFYGVMAQSFFGGSNSDFAPSQDQTAWFKDWTLAVIA